MIFDSRIDSQHKCKDSNSLQKLKARKRHFSIAAEVTILQQKEKKESISSSPPGKDRAMSEEYALQKINERLNANDSLGVNVFMVGDTMFNFLQNTISGNIYLSQPYKQTKKKITQKISNLQVLFDSLILAF